MSFSDIIFKNGLLLVHLRHSKTDPFFTGCTIRIGSTLNPVCSVMAMRRYLQLRGDSRGPLFTFQDGSQLTRLVMSNLLSTCFPDCSLDSHSFRIGGASAAASGGLSDAAIQILGRWSSEAFKRYLHYSDAAVCEAALRMADPSPEQDRRVWDASWLASRFK